MEKNILLAQLRALLERAPNLDEYSPKSREHHTWLAQAHALINRWNGVEAIGFQNNCSHLSNKVMRPNLISNIFGSIHRAIADLELDVPIESEVSFGAGDVYDFFRALNKVISSAEHSIFIIDPYLDSSVFDYYLKSRQKKVIVRLLLYQYANDVVTSANKYIEQHGEVLEIRKSKSLHDRVIFIDDFVCWLVGQSIKDAAKAKPTYLVQLPPDTVSSKLDNYEQIWKVANTLY
jgi:hypothetical protein